MATLRLTPYRFRMTNTKTSPHNKQRDIKTLVATFMALTLLTAIGCRTTNVSSKGGVVAVNEEFSITVPASTTVKQGADTTITIALNRGPYFKRDVELKIKAEGIKLTPSSILVKASDKPDLQIQITATREAALGEYRVSVSGTPATGKQATTAFIVKVVAQ